MNQEKVILKVE